MSTRIGTPLKEKVYLTYDDRPKECSPKCSFWYYPKNCKKSVCPIHRSPKAPTKELPKG